MEDVKIPSISHKIEQKSMMKRCEDLLKAAKEYQKDNDRIKRWQRLDDRFRGRYKGDQKKVETVASNVYKSIQHVAPRKPYIRINAKTPEYVTANGLAVDNVRNARYREGAINQEFDEIKVHRQIKKSMMDAYVPYGFGVLKLGWGIKTDYDQQGKEYITEEGLWIVRHNPKLFYPGILSTDDQDMAYCCWEFRIPKKKALKNKKWDKAIIEGCSSTMVPKNLHGKDMTFGADLDILKIIEFHHIEENWLSTFISGTEDFLEKPHEDPYAFKGIHGAIYRPWPVNDDFYGRSQADLTESQVDDIDHSRQRHREHLGAFPTVVIDYSPNPEKNDLTWSITPYGAKVNMPSGKKGDLEVFTTPPLSKDNYALGEIARSDMQWVLGQSDMTHGQAEDMKATQASIIAGRENISMMSMADIVGEVYEELAIKCGDLLVQYMSGEKLFRYQGEIMGNMKAPFESYTVMDIVGDFDHKVDIESMSPVNNEVKAQTMMNLVRESLDPNMGEVGSELNREYKMVDVIKKGYKLLGVDLEEFKRPKEADPQANDPFQENKIALGYMDESGAQIPPALLNDPLPGEEWHIPIHQAVAMATKNEEIARHWLKHQAMAANTPQGVQAGQMQQSMPQGGGGQRPLPLQPGAPQPPGGALTSAGPVGAPPGVARQINPMV